MARRCCVPLALVWVLGQQPVAFAQPPGTSVAQAMEQVYLYLTAAGSVPGAAFLGGAYRTASEAVAPCLLYSLDDGATWREAAIRLTPHTGVHAIRTFGTSAWALLTTQHEGTTDPSAIAISTDSGRTWNTVALNIDPPSGIPTVEDFGFFDARHGILAIYGSTGERDGAVYTTADGGHTWTQLWSTSGYPHESYAYPSADDDLARLTFVSWDADGERAVSISRVVSADDGFGPYRVQRFSYGGTGEWEEVSSIPRVY